MIALVPCRQMTPERQNARARVYRVRHYRVDIRMIYGVRQLITASLKQKREMIIFLPKPVRKTVDYINQVTVLLFVVSRWRTRAVPKAIRYSYHHTIGVEIDLMGLGVPPHTLPAVR